MVLLHSMKYFNRWLGPFLLRNGVRLRARLVPPGTDDPRMDALLGITVGQWLTSLEANDHANDVIQARESSSSSSSSSSSPLTLEEEAALRVQMLESYVRPALLPNESWHDDVVAHWQFYPRLVRWLRQEYLSARFGPHVRAARQAYPALVQSPQFSHRVPPTFDNIPKASLVQSALCLTSNSEQNTASQNGTSNTKTKATSPSSSPPSLWATSKQRSLVVRDMQRVAAKYGGKTHVVRDGALCWNELPESSSSLRDVPLADVLQLVGANVQVCGPLNTWLEQRQQFQFWTSDYIARLGDYLVQRCSNSNNSPNPTVILEVGAGDGLLTALLQDYVQNHQHGSSGGGKGKTRTNKMVAKSRRAGQRRPTTDASQTPTFIATDDESWKVRKKATVVKLDFRQALEQHATDEQDQDVIVLCSWMPMNEDWTAVFRQYPNVKEYILIGEADDGQCGDGWETWGNPHFANEESDDRQQQRVAPFQGDGFERHNLSMLLPYQFSRYDSAISKEGMTVSFRRKSQR